MPWAPRVPSMNTLRQSPRAPGFCQEPQRDTGSWQTFCARAHAQCWLRTRRWTDAHGSFHGVLRILGAHPRT
eukprot:8937860-Alexandrium_andersonii.AAC.1